MSKRKQLRTYDSSVIKPIKQTFEGINFDSSYEVDVYKHLRMIYGSHQIKCHEPIPVLPASVHFPALFWQVDFHIQRQPEQSSLYIEAKGILTQEFKLVLQALASTSPHVLSNLIVVHPVLNRRIGKTIKTLDIATMYAVLKSFSS